MRGNAGGAGGAAADGAVCAFRLATAVVPSGKGIAATHVGPVERAETHPSVVAEAIIAFICGQLRAPAFDCI